MTQADAPTICLDATPSGLSVPPPPSFPYFMPNALSATTLPIYLGLRQAPNNAGLHTQWLGLHITWFTHDTILISCIACYVALHFNHTFKTDGQCSKVKFRYSNQKFSATSFYIYDLCIAAKNENIT